MKIAILTKEATKYNLLELYLSSDSKELISFDNYEDIINAKNLSCLLVDDSFENILQICEVLHKNSLLPVIMLSNKDDLKTKCLAYDVGCSDYLVEPCSIELLLRKINVHTRNKKYSHIIKLHENITIDKNRKVINVGDEVIDMTLRQFEILTHLLDHANETVSRNELINKLWNKKISNTRIVDTHIKNIRKLVPSIKIDTINGIGYRAMVNLD